MATDLSVITAEYEIVFEEYGVLCLWMVLRSGAYVISEGLSIQHIAADCD